jgi:FdhD protein
VSGTYREREVWRSQGGQRAVLQDRVAEEVPVALLYNDQPHVVMLATPQDLEDFALGFSLSEGIVTAAADVSEFRQTVYPEGIEMSLTIPFERSLALAGKERNLAGRTGCGLCGSKTLAQAVRNPPPVGPGQPIPEAALYRTLANMPELQVLNKLTGAVHAAAWSSHDGEVLLVREDVGRHNALDKLIGALARMGTELSSGFVTVTSRASYEMVQKAATVGISLMAAISAPTDLAIRLAQQTGFTLIGFARANGHVIYANPQRITLDKDAA